jgi:nucleotide-binding universal stress UspA family protein
LREAVGQPEEVDDYFNTLSLNAGKLSREDRMYKKILVPLDGSELAECVLPHVESIAKGRGVESIVLLRVLDTYVPSANFAYVNESLKKEMEASSEEAARKYLDEVAGRINLEGIEVQTQLINGQAAKSIAEYATKNDIGLITIATHGRSGISRWAWGSVADRVLRSACVPVLMVRAPGCVPGI